jgi:hypothetical protein
MADIAQIETDVCLNLSSHGFVPVSISISRKKKGAIAPFFTMLAQILLTAGCRHD